MESKGGSQPHPGEEDQTTNSTHQYHSAHEYQAPTVEDVGDNGSNETAEMTGEDTEPEEAQAGAQETEEQEPKADGTDPALEQGFEAHEVAQARRTAEAVEAAKAVEVAEAAEAAEVAKAAELREAAEKVETDQNPQAQEPQAQPTTEAPAETSREHPAQIRRESQAGTVGEPQTETAGESQAETGRKHNEETGGEPNPNNTTENQPLLDPKARFIAIVGYIRRRYRIDKMISLFTGVPDARFKQTLCDECIELDLSQENFTVKDAPENHKLVSLANQPTLQRQPTNQFRVASSSQRYELGLVRDIRGKSGRCALCRLVWNSFKDQNFIGTAALDSTCYVSWQIDGRALKKLSDGTMKSRTRTRRIRLHCSDTTFGESYIMLVAPYSLSPNTLFLGRQVDSARHNSELIRRWIDICQSSHDHRCKVEHDSKFNAMLEENYFGVIDTWDMCLTKLPKGSSFIALSYTWGKADMRKTLLGNITERQRKGGIKDTTLPRTVQDAIRLTRLLSERYLWVDSLCIIQDSRFSWQLNSSQMDSVYGNAQLTICAADGHDADEGLIALDPARREFGQYIEDCRIAKKGEEFRLMVSRPAESYIEKSTWDTRAWTFQERLLSKRCLIFTHHRVYFQCRSTVMCEDVISDVREEGWSTGWSIELNRAPLQHLSNLDTRSIHVYKTSVELYSKRELTNPDDVLSAFSGMANLVGNYLDATFLYGLPNSYFDWALLWEAHDLPRRRCREEVAGMKKSCPDLSIEWKSDQDFPSWSWVGWFGKMMEYRKATIEGTLTNLREWLMEHTWITWYIRDARGTLRPVWNCSKFRSQAEESDPDHQTPDRWRGYRRPSGIDSSTDLDLFGRKLKWPDKDRSSFELTLPEYPFSVSATDDNARPDLKQPDRRFLQFFTWSAYLHLIPEDPPRIETIDYSFRRFGIADNKQDWCGTIMLDYGWRARAGPDAEFHFIAISEAKSFEPEEYKAWTYYIPWERDQSEWDLYYVLLIEWKEHYWERVGLGKVYKEAFENSCGEGMQWKEIILG